MLQLHKTFVGSINKAKYFNYIYMWGPIVYGPGPFTRRESKGPSRRGLWPKLNKYQVQDRLGIQPRIVHTSAELKSHLKEEQKRQRTDLERRSQNIQGKQSSLPFNALRLTESHSLAFTTTPNDFGYRLMGQVSVLGRLTLHVDEGQ